MARYELRPSKARAVQIAVLGTAMLAFGAVQFVRSGHFRWFYVLWLVVGLGIIGLTLRQGFASTGGRGRPLDLDDSDGTPRGSHHLWGLKGTRDETPGRYALRPSRPAAVVGAIAGAGMIVFGVRTLHGPFVVLWVIATVAIAGFNLWSAFGRGAVSVLQRRD